MEAAGEQYTVCFHSQHLKRLEISRRCYKRQIHEKQMSIWTLTLSEIDTVKPITFDSEAGHQSAQRELT